MLKARPQYIEVTRRWPLLRCLFVVLASSVSRAIENNLILHIQWLLSQSKVCSAAACIATTQFPVLAKCGDFFISVILHSDGLPGI
jgi:hypothetical protein